MSNNLSPSVNKFEETTGIRQIRGVTTSIIAALGVTERGPFTAQRATSWAAWQRIYGGYIANSYLPQAVHAAFLNGAIEIVTMRTTHYSDITNANSYTAVKSSGNVVNSGAGSGQATLYSRAKLPLALQNGQTLIFAVDGVTQPTATIAGARAILTSDNAETVDLSINGGNNDLQIQIDNGPTQTISFVGADFAVPATASAEETAAVINAQITGASAKDNGAGKLLIQSDKLGTGSKVEIIGGTATAAWSFGTSPQVGTGNVADLAAVTAAELKTMIELVTNGITVADDGLSRLLITRDVSGSTKTFQVDAASTADTPLLLDNVLHAGLDSAGGNATQTGSVAEPFPLSPGDTLDVSVDGAGATTVTFNAARASLECANAEVYAFAGGETLTLQVNQGAVQTATASGAHTTAEQVVEDFNSQIVGGRFKLSSAATKVTFESDRAGLESYVQITGGTANGILGFGTSLIKGTGNVDDISAVTINEVKSLTEALVSGVRVTEGSGDVLVISRTDAGVTKTINTSAGTALAKLGLVSGAIAGTTGTPLNTATVQGKTPGSYANLLSVVIGAATSGKDEEFNLSIFKSSVLLESFPNLIMGTYSGAALPTDVRYAPTIVNDANTGSNLIAFNEGLVVGSALQRRPATGDYTMTGGDDGLIGLVDNDFIGDSGAANALYGFDEINDVGMLIVPGKATSAIHNAMLTYCETTRKGDIYALLDPPSGNTPDQVITYVEVTASLKNSSEYGDIHYPWYKAVNPSTDVFGNSEYILLPPSGGSSGVYARVDNSRPGGVYVQPANVENGILKGAIGLETTEVVKEAVRDKLYPANINPIWGDRGTPIHLDGSANLKRNGNFTSIGERRGVIFIGKSIKDGLAYAKHLANTEELRDGVERTTTLFLVQQMKVGAFASKDPATAFFVDAGPALNPPSEQKARRVNVKVGLATATPGEFINIFISQDTRALDEELANLGL